MVPLRRADSIRDVTLVTPYAARMSLQPGTVLLQRYVLRAKLGSGGFGTVWQAIDRVDRVPVAVKVLHPNADSVDRRRFELEARALSRLRHRNCLRLLGSTRLQDGVMVLVTELLSGSSLRELIDAGPISVDQSLLIAAQVAAALDAAHREGVIHRDLKPANVQVDADGDDLFVTVLDFGVAKMLGTDAHDVTKTGEVLGTPGFMSPEQLRGQREIGPSTDLYCLGLLLYEMIEGRPPFQATTVLELSMAHLLEPAPSLSKGPDALRALVADLLQKDASMRPASARAVARRLRQICGLSDDPAPRDSRQTASPGPKGPWRAVGLVGLVAIAAVCGVLAFTPAEPPPPRTPTVSHPQPVSHGPPIAPTNERAPVRPAPTETTDTHGCTNPNPPKSSARHREISAGLLDGHRRLPHYLPSAYDGRTPLPLVLLMHRRGATAEQALDETGLQAIAEREGFIVAALQSERELAGATPWLESDDRSVLDDIDMLIDARCIDQSRMYIVGMDEGVSGADKLACERPVRFAAAVLAGARTSTGWTSKCEKLHRTSIPRLEFVALHEKQTPLQGGAPQTPCPQANVLFDSLDRHEQRSMAMHECRGASRPLALAEGIDCVSWKCEVPYVSCRLESGRFWSALPEHADLYPCYGQPGDGSRAAIAWKFLSQYTRQP